MSAAQNEWARQVRRRIRESIEAKEALAAGDSVDVLVRVAQVIVKAYRLGGKVLLFGNGGSAADAQHIAAELAGKYYQERAPLEAWALHTNTSSLTAIGNDYGYAQVFARQVQATARPEDVVLGLSTSGNSRNVIEALRAAREQGAMTVALTGAGGGRLRDMVDFWVSVPSTDTARIQEMHILLGHILCELVEQELFGCGSQEGRPQPGQVETAHSIARNSLGLSE